jgi:REP element-mobilizing transposase RayT
MTFNPDNHHRCSIRLKNYDYSQTGAYFVTACAQNRECLFGNIQDNVMVLNDAGIMIEKWWLELAIKFPAIDIDAYMVMPNHFHGIVAIVGAALRGRPNLDHSIPEGQPHRVAPSLGDILNWFKTMTTNDYIQGVKNHQWHPFPGKLWQRNYYEHIIRNEDDLEAIREYIINNPIRWADDEENPDIKREQKTSS